MRGQLIDSHCHLDFSCFDADRTAVIRQAGEAGVTRMVVPGVAADSWHSLLMLCADHVELYPALGLHPCFLSRHQLQDLELLESLLEQYRVVAVGEIGLDLYIEDADLSQQLVYLRAQLSLAKRFSLPVILHVRRAHDQMLQQLRRFKLERGGIVHAYSGSLQQAEQYLGLGFKLGIGGALTYDRAKRMRGLVQTLSLDSFVLETDAPDMPLCGFQGQRNLPGRVSQVAEVIAELRGCSYDEVCRQTSSTTATLLAL